MRAAGAAAVVAGVRAGAAAVAAGRGRAGRRLSVRAPSLSPRLRRRVLLALLAALVLGATYQLWLRDSSFVAVDDVQVTGLTTEDSERVRAALTTAAHSMTTLHVDHERLERAIAIYPVVREIEVSTDFPHGLRIHVIEHRPAAIADLGREKVAVAGDGTLLRGLPVEGRLPSIEADGGVKSDRLAGAAALHMAHVAGTAPGPLHRRLERVTTRNEDGIVVELRDGPELIFGDATRARAKWIAVARVLSDPGAAGASYVDVRLPGRPAAGGLPAETLAPVAPAGEITVPGGVPGGAAAPTGPTATDPATVGTDPATVGTDPAATGTAPTTTGTEPGTTGTAPTTGTDPGATYAAPGTGTLPTAPAPTPDDGTGAGAVTAP